MYAVEGVEVLYQLNLTATESRVTFWFMAHVGWEEPAVVSQTDIAKDIGSKQANVSVAMKRLLETNVILRDGKHGRTWCYRLNPNVFWRGTVQGQRALLARLSAVPIRLDKKAAETQREKRRASRHLKVAAEGNGAASA